MQPSTRTPSLALALVVALGYACGPKDSSETKAPGAAAQPETSTAELKPEPRAEPEPPPQLVDAWYTDTDEDGVPDFVELELHGDPNMDEGIVQAWGEPAGEGSVGHSWKG